MLDFWTGEALVKSTSYSDRVISILPWVEIQRGTNTISTKQEEKLDISIRPVQTNIDKNL